MSETTEQVELTFECDGTSGVAWVVRAASFDERLNEPYSLLLNLATDDMNAEPLQMLGQPASFSALRGGVMRQVTGIVSEVVEGSTHPEVVTTNIVVAPALASLRHRVNTKIFQEMTVPEILEEVLNEGLGNYSRSVENRLDRTYPECDYRVQYDESDFSFCQRLMEEEGIVYWFEFEGDAETMVLADATDKYGEIETLHGTIVNFSQYDDSVHGHDYMTELNVRSKHRPTKLVTRHFDWTTPSVPVEGDKDDTEGSVDPDGASVDPEREIYHHDELPLTREPGGTTYGSDKDDQLTIRRQEQAWQSRIAEGRSTVMGMRCGSYFELVGHTRADLDGRYLVVAMTHNFDEQGNDYHNVLSGIPEGVTYRPIRERPEPRIESVQTATVVGPSGEEIHTDEHGRIKVQFHWDRLGASDESSSCWVRVMQPWAGAGWGFVFIPRIGMEVRVEFVNGDPDRPLVTGSLYNGEHPPPYALPDEKTKSTIKTESSLGGGGFNEIRFEDMAGSEEIYTHAQKDQNEVVEADHTTTVGHDQTNTVNNNQLQEISVNQTETVGGNQEMTVDGNRTTHILGSFEETIDGSETRTVSSGVTETIDAGETRTINGGMTEDISGGRKQTIDGDSTETITGALDQTIVGGANITTPASYEITAVGGFTINSGAAVTIIAPGGHQLVAPGGQTTIDNWKFWTGGNYLNNFFLNLSTTCIKFEITGANVGLMNLHIDSSNFKVAAGGVLLQTANAIHIKCAGAVTKADLLRLKAEATDLYC